MGAVGKAAAHIMGAVGKGAAHIMGDVGSGAAFFLCIGFGIGFSVCGIGANIYNRYRQVTTNCAISAGPEENGNIICFPSSSARIKEQISGNC